MSAVPRLELGAFPVDRADLGRITALPGVAMKIGANRIFRGKSFSHPCGNPSVDADAEHRFRVGLIRQALAALQTPVTEPTLFEATGPGA